MSTKENCLTALGGIICLTGCSLLIYFGSERLESATAIDYPIETLCNVTHRNEDDCTCNKGRSCNGVRYVNSIYFTASLLLHQLTSTQFNKSELQCLTLICWLGIRTMRMLQTAPIPKCSDHRWRTVKKMDGCRRIPPKSMWEILQRVTLRTVAPVSLHGDGIWRNISKEKQVKRCGWLSLQPLYWAVVAAWLFVRWPGEAFTFVTTGGIFAAEGGSLFND